MISYLEGLIINKTPTEITLLTGGVGYQIFVSPKTSAALPLNKPCSLFIYTHVREDTLALYGFATEKDKSIFSLLLSVSGVGPKSALTISSVGSSSQIESAIRDADVEFFTQIPGIGKKSAQRIIVDLKPKLGTVKELDLSEEGRSYAEVESALKSLGFSSKEAKEALDKIKNKSQLSDENLIRQALKNLGKHTG